MKHGALFNGIGGFQIAAQWMGWENIFSCEINDFCNKVTKHHFPDCIQHGDITKTDFSQYADTIDILTGGFPCQPHSTAGKQAGSKDERDLWNQCKRAVIEIRPRYALFENVSALLTTDNGRFFNRVLSDLAEIGYNVEWCCLPASIFGAPHVRERIWIISYPGGIPFSFGIFNRGGKEKKRRDKKKKIRGENRFVSKMGTTIYSRIRISKEWLPEPQIPKLVNGLPGELDEIKSFGNAIVPQVAYQIFKAIEQTEKQMSSLIPPPKKREEETREK